MHSSGWVKQMSYPRPSNGIKDTAFSLVTFIGYGVEDYTKNESATDNYEAFINTNFVFDPIDSLNYHRLHTKVLIHDIIPLAFRTEPSFEFEISNYEILPAIDLKKMLGEFSNPAVDSVKKQ
jgi:hypothetical protein